MVLVTYFCQHFHFFCVLCVSRKYPYTTQGELLEIPSRVGGGGREVGSKPKSLLATVNQNWNFQRGLGVVFLGGGEWGWVQTKQSLWEGYFWDNTLFHCYSSDYCEFMFYFKYLF